MPSEGLSCFRRSFFSQAAKLGRGRYPLRINPQEANSTCAQATPTVTDDYESFFTEDHNAKHHPLPLIPLPSSQHLCTTLHYTSDLVAGYVSLLKKLSRCKAISEGRNVHAKIIESAQDITPYLGNVLIQLYGNCGSVKEAQAAFDGLSQPNLYSWTALIKAYGCNGNLCGAKAVFDKMPHRDVVAWTAVMASYTQHKQAYTQNEKFEEALEAFHQMRLKHIKPDCITYVCAVDACAGLAATAFGFELHAAIIHSEHAGDLQVGKALFYMYIKYRCVWDARRLFDMLPFWDDMTWNAMIEALSSHGHHREVVHLFFEARYKDLIPSAVTYTCVVNACTKISALEAGDMVHTIIIESSNEHQLVNGTALVNMYGKCGRVRDARSVFNNISDRDIVAWNAMITVLVQNENFQEALDFFRHVVLLKVEATDILFVCAIEACTGLLSVEDGRVIHAFIVDICSGLDVIVGTALVNMYGKCSCLSDVRSILQYLPHQDVITFTSAIAAFVQNGLCKEALDLFATMMCDAVKPDCVTVMCVLKACASLTAIEVGLAVHMVAVEIGYEQELELGTSLISMYGNCGIVKDAKEVFDRLSHLDIGSWNAMLGVFTHNGNGKEAEALFHQLQEGKAMPDHTTFICILAAFSHAGMIYEGWHLFEFMNREYCLVPMVDHYICMVDLLGRAGHLEMGELLINSMPFETVSFAWRCLLGACKIHGNMEHGEQVARYCFEQDANIYAPYVMMSNLCAAVGKEDAPIVGGLEDDWHENVLAFIYG